MVTIHEDGSAEFAVFMPHAQSVEIVGGFTGWQDRPIAMTRASDGWWTARAELGAGDHEFQYRVNHRDWLPDYAAGGLKMSPFGSWVSLLHVPGETRSQRAALRRAA